MAETGHDTAGLRARASDARVHGLGVGCVAIQATTWRAAVLRYGRAGLRHGREALRHGAQQRGRERRHDARGTACDKAWSSLRHGNDMVPGAPRYCRPSAQCARSLGQGWVHYALDSILTQCTVLSHCLRHCS